MHYASFNIKKILVTGIISTVLVGSVAATFDYKKNAFGDVHLFTALERTYQKYSLLVLHALRFSDDVLAANGLSAFTPSEYRAERPAQAIPVLLYHGLKDNADDMIAPAVFADQMHALHEAGWRTITLNELQDFLRENAELPERSFLLTFDDGARDSYYPVDPILSLFDYQAVSFILPKYSVGGGTHYYLSRGEVESMLESKRWEIGSHGQNSHEFLPVNATGTTGAALANLLWLPEEGRIETPTEFRDRVEKDLSMSQQQLQEAFDVPITTFAFPFGEFGHLTENYPDVTQTVEHIADDIYSLSFYQTWVGEGYSFNYPKYVSDNDMIMVKRIEPTTETSAEELVDMLEDGLPKNLPYYDDFATNYGWFSTWGEPQFETSQLRLKSLPDETGSAVVLDGSALWEDYRVRATVESPSQTGFVIWVRFQDNDNNAGCNFGNGFIHAEDITDGTRRVINGVRDERITIPNDTFTVEVTVSGRKITCTLDNTYEVTTPFLNASLDTGGIGVKVWDPQLGLSEMTIYDVTVEPITHEETDDGI